MTRPIADNICRYDEYLKLEALNQIPEFRWCLGEECSSGQIYNQADGGCISCEHCGLEMCFEHQVKWHNGLTCEQFDSLKENGDPEFEETQDWISKNTKACPECGVSVQKGEGCFHMTCEYHTPIIHECQEILISTGCLCHHEFCWECLANWRDLVPRGSGGYNREAHKDGCYFRSTNTHPTQITGTRVQEAV